jgi:CBS domain-containing protein
LLAVELLAFDQKERHWRLESMKASEIMQASPLCADLSLPIGAAARQLADSQLPRMPVIEAGKLVGMLSRTDYLELLTGRQDSKD